MRRARFVLALLTLSLGTASAEVITLSPSECQPLIHQGPDGEQLSAPGYSICAAPGNPALLFQDVYVLLPPDADPDTVSVDYIPASLHFMDGEHDVAPAPPFKAIVDGQEVYDWAGARLIDGGRNLDVYGSDSFYPKTQVEIVGFGSVRGYRIARLRYYPLSYKPVSRRLQAGLGGEIRVSFQYLRQLQSDLPAQGDGVLAEKVSRWTANAEQLPVWYPSVARRAVSATQTDYLIITTSAISSASSKLQAFVNHKTSRGYSVGVATEAQWGGGTGDAAANRIRAYLKANYLSKGIRYVLLVGNPDPSNGDVPMKMLWPRRGSSTYQEAPSDYFYADLTGNWDLDGDGYYGEGSNDFGVGGVDIYPEVIVGRIPVYGSVAGLDAILQKTIDYESGGIGGDWVKTALLSMKPSDASTPGYHLGEAIKRDALPQGFASRRVYQENYGLSPAPESTPCTYVTVTEAWQQHAGFHFWWTHGNETLASDIMTSDRTSYLDDHYPSFTFQCSCLNGSPENSNNLGYALLKRGATATVSATRVSWYYPGETTFTNSDSNAGMTYKYAVKLVRDHMPCGDALYETMVEIPGSIWMNRCVFNLYGDPSLAYASGPVIDHEAHGDTDVTAQPYAIEAQVTSSGALQAGSPMIKWNTNGGSTYSTVQMTLVNGATYRGYIPSQPLGTTVYYYLLALDAQSRSALSPTDAPNEMHSFRIRTDATPPAIQHQPLAETGNAVGPYTIRTIVTDDTGVSSVVLSYQRNGGTVTSIGMSTTGNGAYEGQIPGPTAAGDTISYYITATDSSTVHNSARLPAQGAYSFGILGKLRVAVYNCSAVPPYFTGGNSNVYQQVCDTLTADPASRFEPVVVTSLSSSVLADKAALVLADNGVSTNDLQAVSNWFVKGKVIMTLESATCYAAYSGFLWPQTAGTNGYNVTWDTNSSVGDQEVVLADSITSGYTVGQVIEARGYEAQFFISSLPADAKVLTRSKNNSTRAYAAYRDVPGRGRIVVLGPYVALGTTHHSIVREGLILPSTDRDLRLTAPLGGAVFETGRQVVVTYETSGSWLASDRVRLEYTTGLDTTWHAIPGGESLLYNTGSYSWDTTGLPGSRAYRVRVSLLGGTLSRECDASFTIVPNLSIPKSKAVPDGQAVKLAGKIVTAGFDGFSYVQEPNREGGIKVQASSALQMGSSVTIVGDMSTVDGERVLSASTVSVAAADARVAPFVITTSGLGGGAFGAQQATNEYRIVREGNATSKVLLAGQGLSNIGLLVRVAGAVTAAGATYFYLDDGGMCDDGSGAVGVRVICGSASKPPVGSRVVVTGVSSTYYERGNLWKALLMTGIEPM